MFKKILFPTDFSGCSVKITDFAIKFALNNHSEIVFFHVLLNEDDDSTIDYSQFKNEVEVKLEDMDKKSEIHGIKFMSIVYYTQDNPLPIRGDEISNALIEILSVTRWNDIDYLVVDMPPGLGDNLLDLMRLLRRGEYLIITTPSN
jgi:Mrp family chromosome partitioning ATPase